MSAAAGGFGDTERGGWHPIAVCRKQPTLRRRRPEGRDARQPPKPRDSRNPASGAPTGSAGDRTSASAPGARCARTTAPAATAWDYFPHDHARSRAYRWNEDGLAGICDRHQRICFALALWNGRDPILKERLFGLTGSEGNHGEDVKEYYFYLDSTPTHSYMKFLYKYPQAAFPYAQLVEENRRRGKHEPEFELIDTGVFDDDRYFDVVVEYAKADRRRHPDPDPRRPTAAPRPRRSICCRPSGSATPGRGQRRRVAALAAARAAAEPVHRARRADVRPALAALRQATPDAALHRERDQHRSGCSATPTTARRT